MNIANQEPFNGLLRKYIHVPGATIADGDRKSWNPRAPTICDNFSIFRTNCAILTTYIRADFARVLGSRANVVTLLDQMVRVPRFCTFRLTGQKIQD